MLDNTETEPTGLSHDRPCVACGHSLHIYYACDKQCDCGPQTMPGAHDLPTIPLAA